MIRTGECMDKAVQRFCRTVNAKAVITIAFETDETGALAHPYLAWYKCQGEDVGGILMQVLHTMMAPKGKPDERKGPGEEAAQAGESAEGGSTGANDVGAGPVSDVPPHDVSEPVL